MEENLEKLKEIVDLVKLCDLADPNGEHSDSIESENSQEKINVFKNISKLHISLKGRISSLLLTMDNYLKSPPEENENYINFLYLQKLLISLNSETEQNIIWKIAYLNGSLLNQNLKKIEVSSSLTFKLSFFETIMDSKNIYLSWYDLNKYFTYFDYNLSTLACNLLKLYFFIIIDSKFEKLNETWIISILNKRESVENTIKFMESMISEYSATNK